MGCLMSDPQIVNTSLNQGIKCLDSGETLYWDDEDIASCVPQTCIQLIVNGIAPEMCAVGGLPLSEAWQKFYDQHSDDYDSLEELIQAFPFEGVVLLYDPQGPIWSNDKTFFFMPSNAQMPRWSLI